MRRTLLILFISSLLTAQVQNDLISVTITAAIEPSGSLRAVVNVEASGAPSRAFREAYGPASRKVPAGLWGPFLNSHPTLPSSAPMNADDPAQPFRINFSVQQNEFMIPVQRVGILQLNPLPPLTDPIASGAQLRVGQPGLRRTQASFDIPPGFELQADVHIHENRPFAKYSSEALVESGKLVVVRELEIRDTLVDTADRSSVDEFLQTVRTDEQRAFVLRRVARVDASAWISSVPAARANTLGVRALEQREYEAARQLFEKSITADPRSTVAWNSLGRALTGLGRIPEAQKAFEQQIAVHPADVNAYNNLALLLEREGDWPRAIGNLQKQLEVDPGNHYAAINLPHALMEGHRWAELEAAARKVLIATPNDATQKLNVAIARACVGTTANPREEIDRALGPQPSPTQLNNAAYYLAECDIKPPDLPETYTRRALDQLRNAAPPPPDALMSRLLTYQNRISTFLDTYGWVLFKEGKYQAAKTALSNAAFLHPRAEVYAHLALTNAQLGDRQGAAVQVRQAVFLEPGLKSRFPPDLLESSAAAMPISIDREWYPIALPSKAAPSLPSDQIFYFFVYANADGKVRESKALVSTNEALRGMLESIVFPVVRFEGEQIPSVHIVRVRGEAAGNISIAESTGAEATAIASALSPEDFPVAAPPTPAPPTATSSSSAALRVGNGVSSPNVISRVDPKYTEEARLASLQGTVRLSIVVGSDGLAHDVSVTVPLGFGLDESAIECIRQWRFQPGALNGRAVNVRAAIEVNFRLLTGLNAPPWHTGGVGFTLPSGGTRPGLIKSTPPHANRNDSAATATIGFTVDDQGNVLSPHVEKSSNEDWAKDALSALSNWKFTPGQKDGMPVAVPATIDFERGP